MSTMIQSILTSGASGIIVQAECHLSNSLPSIVIVGLGNKAVDEAKERIRSALASSNIPIPRKRITVNLAPADIPKNSTALDVAIALAILQAGGQLQQVLSSKDAVVGELGLDGTIRPVRGVIGMLLAGKQHGVKTFYIPRANMDQALLVPGVTVVPLRDLGELHSGLQGQTILKPRQTGTGAPGAVASAVQTDTELHDIAGQERAKRAITIAAAGGHNIFLNGPPGTGKSMLARALPALLPVPSAEEMLEITHIHSLVNNSYGQLLTARPFRAPHHSISHIAMIGGGNAIRPGEVSLSHRGVLFLDEFPEFGRATIESLRQPLEDRVITVTRANDSVKYPANFLLVATANPCPCGYFGSGKPCDCPASHIARYRQKLSGPIMDRFDIYVDVEPIDHANLLTASDASQGTEMVKKQICQARQAQMHRFGKKSSLNAEMTNRAIKAQAQLHPEARAILNQAATRLDISARSYMRLIKISRTIADLDGSHQIMTQHIAEALQYRAPGRAQAL